MIISHQLFDNKITFLNSQRTQNVYYVCNSSLHICRKGRLSYYIIGGLTLV